MKRKKQLTPRARIALLAGWIVMGAGMILAILQYGKIIPMIFICAGITTILANVLLHNPYGAESPADERTKKLSAQAVSQSWLITLLAVMLLFWSEYLHIVALSGGQILGMLLLIMIVSATILQWIQKRRPDIS